MPTPLVLFVDPAIADLERFRQLVAQRAPERTTLVRRPLEDLPRHRDLARVEALPNFQNAAPEKDTARYLILNCSKLDMLREAIHQNDHGTDFFAWMDAGIAHVARPPDVFPHASHGVAFLQMRAVSLQETASRNEFYARERGRLAATFFRGSGKRLLDLAQAFSDELDATLASGLRANEQMVLSRLSAIRPELFELYYGDYSSVLCNWDRIRDGIDVVFLNLAHCREHGLWATSRHICEALEASQDGLDREQQARWLDELFISAWYNGDIDRSRDAAARLLSRCQETAWFTAQESRIRGNLSFLERASTAPSPHVDNATPPPHCEGGP